ncbi:dihydrofolate reductase [Trichophyton mentagrophytes]|uniref:Dihydrofolate reductase n=1 Tax=Trichophyton interdigitale (strain MR816) TaxID=1215338 RepID=A0A059J912_TRIIM|nr:hypothetical protein H101_03438 [Trichophyton interdigitale H6]KDB23972.1 hypothetical protein H109_04144 [Trichophyton interdigitale MR816]GBF66872.1 dihydrofolate reductase [Trichophyton mentagrophytes]
MTTSVDSPRMPAKLPPLTLIVATTPVTTPTNHGILKLGIGKGGTLPWPRIKKDMSFFARVTTRPPTTATGPGTASPAINAVIMGRKTYDSIPAKFRPLPKRLNVIITRDESGSVKERAIADWNASRNRELEKQADHATGKPAATPTPTEEPEVIVSSSLEDALSTLQRNFVTGSSSDVPEGKRRLGNVYIMGGSEIYASSLRLTADALGEDNPLRIVMTDIRRRAEGNPQCNVEDLVDGFDCDTCFPLDGKDLKEGWNKVPSEKLAEWVGEAVSSDWAWEGDVAMKISGYERV